MDFAVTWLSHNTSLSSTGVCYQEMAVTGRTVGLLCVRGCFLHLESALTLGVWHTLTQTVILASSMSLTDFPGTNLKMPTDTGEVTNSEPVILL